LQEVIIFDVYQSVEMAKIAKKSASFRLTFQSSAKTLEKKEIEEMIRVVSKNLQKRFSAELRE
jgi:phenylalanyl-tRNA synthetase beta subunit